MPQRRLKTMEDLRRYVAGLINRVEKGEVDSVLAGKLGYLAATLQRIIEGGELEKRLDEIERMLDSKPGKQRGKVLSMHR